MMRSKRTPMILAVLLSLASPCALHDVRASGENPRHDDTYTVVTGVGFGDEQIVGGDERDQPNPLFGLRWDHFYCYDRSFFVDAAYTLYNGELSHGDTEEISSRLGVQKLFGKSTRSSWFLAGAVGFARFDPEHAPSP